MNLKRLTLILGLGCTICGAEAQTPKLNPDNIEEVIAAMTTEEKAHLIVGTSLKTEDEVGVVGYTKDIVPGAAGTTYPIERLGIPAIVLADGPAGLRISPRRDNDPNTYFCTGFPIGLLLASTWSSECVENIGAAIGDEVREYGADVLLAPGMNIQRNPLCGRNFEYYSEDPLLSGMTAAAYVAGVQSAGVGTSIKHFAVNNQEINRLANDARVSPRALREIYLRNFEYAVRHASPWTVMTSYNYVNGRYTSEDRELLTDILRDEWGFDGAVMTDWGGGLNSTAQIAAGNDMIQPGSDGRYRAIIDGIEQGTLSMEDLDCSVRRILQLIVRTPRFADYEYSNAPDLAAHAALTRSAAAEGMVLLKNENGALPLTDTRRVALFGTSSYKFIAGGTGSGDVNKAYVIDLVDGMRNAGFVLSPTVDAAYAEHMRREGEAIESINSSRPWYIPRQREEEIDCARELAIKAIDEADAAIITIGRNAGEGFDRHVEDDYMLTRKEQRMIEQVGEVFHSAGKPVIVILNICGLVDTAAWRDCADAILISSLPGQEGGNAVADVISGMVSPSGHLPVSMPLSYDQVSAQRFPKDVYEWKINASFLRYSKTEKFYEVENIDYTDYTEDIFVGYRHFATRDMEVAYPFGWGLTYTTFAIEASQWRMEGDRQIVVECRVTNTGTTAAKQVVQLYSSKLTGSEPRPEIELRAYAKTPLLQPGQTCSVEMRLGLDDLAWFDQSQSAWITQRGEYRLLAGDSSQTLQQVGRTLIIERDKVRKVHDAMRPEGELFIGASCR
ncbi:MAG: beta-glucosidase [Alistipes sp.]|nr:beta-glucosidase [Alistipes sp.]